MRISLPACLAGMLLASSSLPAAPVQQASTCCTALDQHALTTLDTLMPKLLDKQVVFVGETHDEYAHHIAQLEIIRRLHGAHPDLVIAMEQFRQPSQPDLDDYVADRIDEKTLLQRTRFFQTSNFDYRLFRPVLRYARDEHIPIVALNIPDEISHEVAQGGFAALAGDERKWIPAEIDRENLRYRQRVNEVYHLHPQGIFHGFENFLEAQLLWDEGMAARAADYLQNHSGIHMVVLSGSGHLIYGDGIPSRLVRRTKLSSAIVLNDVDGTLASDMGDILLVQAPQSLPPAGNLGLSSSDANGSIRVDGLDDDSAAGAAGVLVSDILLALDGQQLQNAADLSIALLDKAPGDTARLRVLRSGWAYGPQRELEIPITLR
jgi:uncharacterized iron-regulated protein